VLDRRIQEEHSQTPADNLCVIGLQAFFMRLGQNVTEARERPIASTRLCGRSVVGSQPMLLFGFAFAGCAY
jgi:hypothetical protein